MCYCFPVDCIVEYTEETTVAASDVNCRLSLHLDVASTGVPVMI